MRQWKEADNWDWTLNFLRFVSIIHYWPIVAPIMNDFFCTPNLIARSMAEAFQMSDCPIIADFAVGDGSLLHACEALWPNSLYYAVDIQQKLVSSLSLQKPNWRIATCDFLDTAQRTQALDSMDFSSCSAIILNPPFSCRGNRRYSSQLFDVVFKTSLAMAFVITSLQYLDDQGEMVALLPVGCIYSEKDHAAWEYIRNHFTIDSICSNHHSSFPNCAASTEVIRISRLPGNEIVPHGHAPIAKNYNLGKLSLFRGSFSMNEVSKYSSVTGIPLLHTTCVTTDTINTSIYSIEYERNILQGPLLLVPRVGRPDKRKIITYDSNDQVILSDCLFGLAADSYEICESVKKIIWSNWDQFEPLYRGTGAKYLTRKVLALFLMRNGYEVIY
ncbi:MAG: N-6 DNA methylase [bacterium]